MTEFTDAPPTELQSRTIYVNNLPFSTTSEEVAQLFSQFGPINNVEMLPNRKGLCFVEFADGSSVQASSGAQLTLGDRQLHVEPRRFPSRNDPDAPPRPQFPEEDPDQPTTGLWVRGFPADTTPDEITKYFENLGAVDRTSFRLDRGFGVIFFADRPTLENVLAQRPFVFQNVELEAEEKKPRRRPGARRGGSARAGGGGRRPRRSASRDADEKFADEDSGNRRARSPPPPMLYAKNFLPGTTPDQVRAVFERFGAVADVAGPIDRGYCFISFANADDMHNALSPEVGPIKIGDQTLIVEQRASLGRRPRRSRNPARSNNRRRSRSRSRSQSENKESEEEMLARLNRDNNRRVWLGNLYADLTRGELEDLLAEFGQVTDMLFRSRQGYAIVTFADEQSVDKITGPQDAPLSIGGREFKVERARAMVPRAAGPRRTGRRRGRRQDNENGSPRDNGEIGNDTPLATSS